MKPWIALLAISLAACGAAEPEAQPAAEAPAGEAPAAAATLPGTAQVQAAFDKSCPGQPKIASATCTALEDPTEFKCAYTQEAQDTETPSETLIAADADTFVLIDLPNNCQVQ